MNGDGVTSVSFLDTEESNRVKTLSENELQDAFSVKLEMLPDPGASRQALSTLLEVYSANELEFATQIELGKKNNFDFSRYEQALEEVRRRKAEVQKMIKNTN